MNASRLLLLLFLLAGTFQIHGQIETESRNLWLTVSTGYNFETPRFGIKAEYQSPKVKWLTIGGEVSVGGHEPKRFKIFPGGVVSEENEWCTNFIFMVDYHPMYHWNSNPKWDPYIGAGRGYFIYFDLPTATYDFSYRIGTKYWLGSHWALDLDLGYRESRMLSLNLGMTYKFI